jgi:hypothetical protein
VATTLVSRLCVSSALRILPACLYLLSSSASRLLRACLSRVPLLPALRLLPTLLRSLLILPRKGVRPIPCERWCGTALRLEAEGSKREPYLCAGAQKKPGTSQIVRCNKYT